MTRLTNAAIAAVTDRLDELSYLAAYDDGEWSHGRELRSAELRHLNGVLDRLFERESREYWRRNRR